MKKVEKILNIQRGGDGEEETGHGTNPTMGNTKLILVNFNVLPHSIKHLTTERRPSGPKNNLLIRIWRFNILLFWYILKENDGLNRFMSFWIYSLELESK